MEQCNIDADELDWRIYAPRVRRLLVYIGIEESSAGHPRLWLMDGDYDGEPPSDVLQVAIPRDMFFGKTWPDWNRPLPRLGTWARYRDDLRWFEALVDQLGWTLSDEEQALVDALEAYAQQAPARRLAA